MREKFLGKLDPRPKLMLMAAASGLVMFSKNLWFPIALLVMLMLLLFFGGASMYVIWRRARVLFATIVALFVIQSVFAGIGAASMTPVFYIGGYAFLYREGILLACMLSLRLIIILFAALVLLEGDTSEYLLALIKIKIPYELAFMVTVSLHFLPIMRMEAVNVYRCMLMRGMEFKDIGLIHKVKAYTKLCLPIFASVLRRARDYSVAMESRSFRASPRRTYYRELKLRGLDIVMLILFPLLITAIFMLTEVIQRV